jgi:hypothetical protein
MPFVEKLDAVLDGVKVPIVEVIVDVVCGEVEHRPDVELVED